MKKRKTKKQKQDVQNNGQHSGTPRKRNVSKDDSWFAKNASKRRGEKFFLVWSVIWMSMVAIVVVTQMFETWDETSYMIFGICIGFPCVILPFIFPGTDKDIHWTRRYTTKANVWCFLMAWVSNYFWTHYFYKLLGARYTMPAWRLNDVPFALYLITQSYFCSYHTISTLLLRRVWHLSRNSSKICQYGTIVLVIGLFAYFIAFMEAFTLQNYPHYAFEDRWLMYTFGSGFYAIYFLVSFPMFYRLDETPGECWSLQKATIDGLANCMLIFQCIDFWRLFVGPIFQNAASSDKSLPIL